MAVLAAKRLLFDLDGTLVYSLPAVERAWRTFAHRHGLDEAEVFHKIHGKRSIDSIRSLLPDVDHEAEDRFIRNLEATDTKGVVAVPGAVALLARLDRSLWGIVTSGTSDVAMARWRAGGLPEPSIFVFGEDVERGKPWPDPFLLGASRLGVDPADCVAFEDTLAGLQAIRAAGMTGIGVGIESEFSIPDYQRIHLSTGSDGVQLSFDSAQ